MPTETIQVALVDDHRLFRSGILLLVNSLSRYKVIVEAGNGKEFIQKISKKFKPGIVLLDLNMPEMDGIATAEWLRENYPEICIIILSMYEDAEKVLALVKIGIKGYLLKDSEPKEFKNALDAVAGGEIYYPSFVTKYLIRSLDLTAPGRLYKINERERQFLKFAGTELTYKEIADMMCVSVRTVDGYRDQLFDKLQVKSRVGLVLYAIKNKLIDV